MSVSNTFLYAAEIINYYPFVYFYGLPRNLLQASDSYSSLWFEIVDQNFSAAYYSLFETEFTEDIAFYGYGHSHTGIESSMYWQQSASFPARNGETVGTSYELILCGFFTVPIGVAAIKPCYRVNDQGGLKMQVALTLFDAANINTAVYSREATVINKSNEVYEDDTIQVDGFSTTAGFRRIFFQLYAKVESATGIFYELIIKLPRIEGLDF